jgi:hypothetical protein
MPVEEVKFFVIFVFSVVEAALLVVCVWHDGAGGRKE